MNRWLLTILLAGASLLVLCPERSEAQRMRRGNRGGNGYYGPGYYPQAGYGGVYGYGQYVMPGANYITTPDGRISLYPPDLGIEADPATTARVTVNVPDPNAQLWFNGVPMPQRGTSRTFTTPSLTPDTPYHYIVRASWQENGRTVERTRTVDVTAGQPARVSFGGGGRQDDNDRQPAGGRRGGDDRRLPRPGQENDSDR
jgi:uncharacterized protein (TIGR03000 family)